MEYKYLEQSSGLDYDSFMDLIDNKLPQDFIKDKWELKVVGYNELSHKDSLDYEPISVSNTDTVRDVLHKVNVRLIGKVAKTSAPEQTLKVVLYRDDTLCLSYPVSIKGARIKIGAEND